WICTVNNISRQIYLTDNPEQVFDVRFLGSMAVRCGNNQEVIYEAMRQVLAARAIHNIFRTTEAHLMLKEVSQFAAHQENGRLMGFVVEGRDWSDENEEGEPSFSAFVFESNTEGEKVGSPNIRDLFFCLSWETCSRMLKGCN
ncbi:hypothetical protein XENOCAPTIV_010458, partial [Xenoophorus captivus]